MPEEKDMQNARKIFKTLCDMLDGMKWVYQKNEDELSVSLTAHGDDLPIEVAIWIDTGMKIIKLLSRLPFTVPEKRREALAIAVSQANNGMVHGGFDYDYLNGTIGFRMTSSYKECVIGKELLQYMLICSCQTIDNYNDKFLMLVKNDSSNEEVLNTIQ